jgi:hypothetical protein
MMQLFYRFQIYSYNLVPTPRAVVYRAAINWRFQQPIPSEQPPSGAARPQLGLPRAMNWRYQVAPSFLG